LALLKDQLVAQGAFLFRWRSVLPLLLAVPMITALPQSGYFEYRFGEFAEGILDIFCVLVAFSGLALRVATIGFVPSGTSGRNTREQRADTLNTCGLYSVTRNPLYLGNLITLIGFVMAVKVWWVGVLAIPITLFYYERMILAEEVYLGAKFGPAYEAWAARTPAFLPNLRRWRRPELPFSAKTALRREYHGFYLIVVVVTLIELLTDVVGKGQSLAEWMRADPDWLAFFAVGSLAYVTIRLVRKKTRWLVVRGR